MLDGTEQYIKTIEYLGKMYDYFNDLLFHSRLIRPVITVQRDPHDTTYGSWSDRKIWIDTDNDYQGQELNITAQHLSRDFYEVSGTLIHEMCHQYASVCGIKDTSRAGTYHNALFGEIAISHGLMVELTNNGWSQTSPTPKTCELADSFLDRNRDITLMFRNENITEKKKCKSSTRTYICPHCRQTIRATKKVNIMCLDCKQIMVLRN